MNDLLAEKIAAQIREDFIESPGAEAGDKLPTVRTLKAKYETSTTTIVQALSILEVQGALVRRHGVGCYIEDRVSPKLIGYIGTIMDLETTGAAYHGMERVVHAYGYHVLVASSNCSYDIERRQVDRMVSSGCKAIILYPTRRTGRQLKDDYLKSAHKDLPIVMIDMAYPEQGRPQVVFDNYRAGLGMTELLLKKGHRRIAFMAVDNPEGDYMLRSTAERYRGYRDALSAAGLTPREEDRWVILEHGAKCWEVNDILPFLLRWRRQSDHPTAVIALQDLMAVQVMNLAGAAGISIPDELEVVGFDNLAVGQTYWPSFTTTEPDFFRAGELAAEIAMEQINGKASSQVVYMLPVPIKERSHTSRVVREMMSGGSEKEVKAGG